MTLFRGHACENTAFEAEGEWELLAGKAEFAQGRITIPEKAGYAILKRK